MDWNNLKAEYIAGGTSYRKLAKKHNIPFSTLKNVATKEHWAKLREQTKYKATTKLIDSISEDIAKNCIKINDVADKLLNKISETIDAIDMIDSQSIKHFTSALKDLKDIKGLKSDIDIREQEARIDKLRKDVDGNKQDDDKVYGVVLMPPIMNSLTPPREEKEDDG